MLFLPMTTHSRAWSVARGDIQKSKEFPGLTFPTHRKATTKHTPLHLSAKLDLRPCRRARFVMIPN